MPRHPEDRVESEARRDWLELPPCGRGRAGAEQGRGWRSAQHRDPGEKQWKRLCCCGCCCGLCAGLREIRRVSGVRHGVYWNSSNPRFLKDDYTVRVEINDYLDIYCPHYDSRVPVEHTESFVLYMVDREGYEGCYETPSASKRWECNRPHAPYGPIKFSEKIQRFTPFSLGFEFREGKDYYYISIPNADSVGECMKLRLSVCCQQTTVRPVTEVPKSQPRGGSPGGGGKSPSQGGPQKQDRSSSFQLCVSPLLLTLCLFLLLLWV
ncbi:ephrin-A4-like [Hyperolius riggenbachi]|uniref:ephrin-A4-like n=1 Tax=Hyperolius riggenbachi TaxID=752182 RepID=UPI0035A2F0C2